MEIEVAKLNTAVDLLQPGIGKGAFSLSDNLFILNKKFITFNGNIFVMFPTKLELTGMVNYSAFNALVKNISESIETINIEQNKDKIIVSSNKTKKTKLQITFNTIESDNEAIMSILKTIKKQEFIKFDTELKTKIMLASFCASEDYTQPERTGVFVTGKHVICASDFRFIYFKHKSKIDSFLLPATSAFHLNKYNIVEYSIHKNWLFCKTKEGVVIGFILLPVTSYSKTEEVALKYIAEIKTKDVEKFPKGLNSIIKRSLIFLKDTFELDKRINLIFTKKQITVYIKNEFAEFKESMDCSLKTLNKELTITINPLFLIEALKHSTSFKIQQNKMIILSEDFLHFINLS